MYQHGAIEDQYLDFLINLAFEKQECDEIAAISTAPVNPEDLPDKHSAYNALNTAYERVNIETRHKHQTKLLSIIGRLAANAIKIAACIALVIVIAGPVAFAQSPFFRSKVMALLMQFDHDHETVTYSFEEVPDAAFNVPAEWTGTYFMSYIPEGLKLNRINPEICYVEFTDSHNRVLSFAEYDDDTTVIAGTEGTTLSYIEINGHTAYIIEGIAFGGLPTVSVTWTNQMNWFSLTTYGISKDEVLKIAFNIKPIYR